MGRISSHMEDRPNGNMENVHMNIWKVTYDISFPRTTEILNFWTHIINRNHRHSTPGLRFGTIWSLGARPGTPWGPSWAGELKSPNVCYSCLMFFVGGGRGIQTGSTFDTNTHLNLQTPAPGSHPGTIFWKVIEKNRFSHLLQISKTVF